jgi:DNA-binding NarL/FixJ family response regulator
VTIRVVLADDERLVRAGLRMILNAEPDITIVAEAGDGREAVQAVRGHPTDVVLMDIRMPTMDGLEATRRILDGPGVPPRVIVAMEEKLAVVRTGRDGREIRDRVIFLGGRHPWQWPQSAQDEDEQEQTTP